MAEQGDKHGLAGRVPQFVSTRMIADWQAAQVRILRAKACQQAVVESFTPLPQETLVFILFNNFPPRQCRVFNIPERYRSCGSFHLRK